MKKLRFYVLRWARYASVASLLLGMMVQNSQAQNCTLSYEKEVKKLILNDSVTIAYKESGKGKQTLLMVHGLGGNLSHWQHNFVYRPQTDLLDFYAEVILQFIQKKKLKRVVLVGHSMGGQIAVIAALKKPQAFQKLVLAAPAGLETFTEVEAQSLRSFSKPEIFKNQNEAMVRAGFRRNFYAMPTSVEALIQDRLLLAQCPLFGPYFEAVAAGVGGMLAHPVRQELRSIKHPTLVVFGEKDDLIPNQFLHKDLTTRQVAEIGRQIPDVQIQLIPQAGHLLMFEQALRFNELLQTFINQ
jgi:pimeloyl-ACP methyl ester carboxylesterase